MGKSLFPNQFAEARPAIGISRSRFNRHWDHKTTFNGGKLIPIMLDEVLPGDTMSMDLSLLTRMSTPIYPVMDNCYLDVYFYFVPNRLTWEHWKNFLGEQDDPDWFDPETFEIPMIEYGESGSSNQEIEPGSIGDYLGIPTLTYYAAGGEAPFEVSALPGRALRLIWNKYFRDENLQNSKIVSIGDTETDGTLYGDLYPVAKIHDYFTSCLPNTAKGGDVLIPSVGGIAPVHASNGTLHYDTSDDGGIKFDFHGDDDVNIGEYTWQSGFFASGKNNVELKTYPNNENYPWVDEFDDTPGTLRPYNLYADLSSTLGTINQLREAFAVQRILERCARGGSRYKEILKAAYGITIPDDTVQDPEFLGGKRITINMNQVVQTSSPDESTVRGLGSTGAVSKTSDSGHYFTKSFVEHGYVIGVCCVRTDHTYQQGLNKLWSRKSRFDFYDPALAHIGEQPVKKREIFLAGNQDDDDTFGFQEAWAEYRYKPSFVSGAFRSNNPDGSLDPWHYADVYDSAPTLSDGWIQETDVNIDRTLATQGGTYDQFIADFYFKCDTTRALPVYSTPGLIDHF